MSALLADGVLALAIPLRRVSMSVLVGGRPGECGVEVDGGERPVAAKGGRYSQEGPPEVPLRAEVFTTTYCVGTVTRRSTMRRRHPFLLLPLLPLLPSSVCYKGKVRMLNHFSPSNSS